MANLAVGGIYKHRTFCYAGSQVGINTRYFSPTSITGSTPTEAAFAAALDLILQPLYLPMLTSTAKYIGSDIQNITTGPPYPAQVGTNANSAFGTGGSSGLPTQTSGIYTVTTGFTGKGFRGRQYIPFPSTTASTGGPQPFMTSAYQTLLGALATETVGGSLIEVGLTDVNILWLIRHESPELLKGSITPTVGFKVGANWATIRRRGDFGRTNPLPLP